MNKFSLSKASKILWILFVILVTVLFKFLPDKSTYQAGTFIGMLIGLFLAPLFAWIIWLISGKKEGAGNLAFSLILAWIMIMPIIGRYKNKYQNDNFEKYENKFKKNVTNSNDSTTFDKAYEEYKNSLRNEFKNLADESQGNEKLFYKIMGNYVNESGMVIQEWQNSFDASQEPRILDYSLLNNAEEFAFQESIIKTYIEKSRNYKEYFFSMIPNLKEKLSVLGEDDKSAKASLKGAQDKYAQQKPIFEPLINAHIQYGNNLLQVLELLQKNENKWSYEDGELIIDDEEMLIQFQKLDESIANNETAITVLAEKIREIR